MEGLGIQRKHRWMLSFPRDRWGVFFLGNNTHPPTRASCIEESEYMSQLRTSTDKYADLKIHIFFYWSSEVITTCPQSAAKFYIFSDAWFFLSWVLVLPSINSLQLKKSSGFVPPKNRSFQRRHLFMMETKLWNKWLKIIWGTLTDLWWDFFILNH